MNKENLTKLANYLASGAVDDGFDMWTYESCAIGYGPDSGIPKLHDENWGEYYIRAFGVARGYSWDWCFSGEWRYRDNTPQGAAARILYLVEHGVPPADWDKSGVGGEDGW